MGEANRASLSSLTRQKPEPTIACKASFERAILRIQFGPNCLSRRHKVQLEGEGVEAFTRLEEAVPAG
jgi:hypothetical protein